MSDQHDEHISARCQAQQRADDIRVFNTELLRLQAEGILTLSATQRQALANHHRSLLADYAQTYDIDRSTRAKQLSLGMRIASFLGALALAASVFFLFYQFWGHFSETVQVATLIAAALSSFLLTVYVQGRDTTGYFTKLAALVAFACFVLDLTMIGQIFNVTPSDQALLPWAALAFLLAYTCDLRLLLATGILCLIAFISARVGTWNGVYWLHLGQRPENFFVAAVLLLLLPGWLPHRRHPEFPAIYRVLGGLAVFLPILVLSHWGHGSYLEIAPKSIESGYQLLGFLGSAIAIGIGIRRGWPDTVNTGISFFVLFLYTKFYDWWWEVMPKYLFFLTLGVAAVLILLILKRLRHASVITGGEP